MNRHSLVAVLAEDERHQALVRRYLYKLGYERHQIRYLPLPSGRGCGEQWVREHYTTEVKAYRSRSAHAKTALIVAIDADKGTVDDRLRQFRESLEQSGLSPRKDHEEIVHLVPRRNVETWFLCLSGTEVDEIEDYSHRSDMNQLIPSAVERFFEWTRPNVLPPARCVPSLAAAIPEAQRLE